MAAYSMDLRTRVLQDSDAGMTADAVAETYHVSAALRVTGLAAPGLLDGPMDGDCFLAYLDQILVPTLQAGDIVVMDNLALMPPSRSWTSTMRWRNAALITRSGFRPMRVWRPISRWNGSRRPSSRR